MKPRLLCHCSFVPVRLLETLGFETISIAGAQAFSRKPQGELVSPYLCSCMQALGNIDLRRFDGVILCNCCASAERLYDALRGRYPEMFVYLLEAPVEVSPPTLQWMRTRFEHMLVTLHTRFQLPIPIRLQDAARQTADVTGSKTRRAASVDVGKVLAWDEPISDSTDKSADDVRSSPAVWLMGSGIHPAWLENLKTIYHGMRLWISDCDSRCRGDELISAIVQGTNEVEPCPRMTSFVSWFERALKRRREIRGVIGMAAQKCDFGLFALPAIRRVCERAGVPALLLEEEYTPNTLERSRIRLEAFHESISRAYVEHPVEPSSPNVAGGTDV